MTSFEGFAINWASEDAPHVCELLAMRDMLCALQRDLSNGTFISCFVKLILFIAVPALHKMTAHLLFGSAFVPSFSDFPVRKHHI